MGTRFKARECRDGLWNCYKCGAWKPATDFYKNQHPKNSSGLRYECKICSRKDVKDYYEALPEDQKFAYIRRQQANNRKSRFGVTQEQYDEMLERQGHVCAICEEVCNSGRKLSVDHNHTTGQVRDLLCGRCNKAIGLARERVDLLEIMIKYLEKWA